MYYIHLILFRPLRSYFVLKTAALTQSLKALSEPRTQLVTSHEGFTLVSVMASS